ncbi:MAG: hypothetical protein RL172_2109 [Bacteroidota bacterium]|jgi:anti-anti-sigma factor
MNLKTDTKEKFTVFTPEETALPVNMTENLVETLNKWMQKDIPHVILNLKAVESLPEKSAEAIATLQQKFYENHCSFVICELQPAVESMLEKIELLEVMNVTPTESEAWDIVQMEEIERELLGGEE